MRTLLKRENLKKITVITIVLVMLASNIVPLVWVASEVDKYGNKLSSYIAYTQAEGGYCKITAKGTKVGIKFPYVDSAILSWYLYKTYKITCDYKYVKNGRTYYYHYTWTGLSGTKSIKLSIPLGTTNFKVYNAYADFQFNSNLLTTGLWHYALPKYVSVGPLVDLK